ncbi:MAG: hypothetical protein U1D30_22205 [Planctomycetota bacterium]
MRSSWRNSVAGRVAYRTGEAKSRPAADVIADLQRSRRASSRRESHHLAEAEAELRSAFTYLNDQSPSLGVRFLDQIADVAARQSASVP